METAVQELLDYRASCSLRGVPLPALITEGQQLRADIDSITSFPGDYLLVLQADDPLSNDERVAQLTYYWQQRLNWLAQEVERRRNMKTLALTNQQSVRAIKESAGANGLVEAIGWYTDVFIDKRQWIFRCPLHEDRHPSGVIYQDELRWHCFQHNGGGDVFDAVIAFGRVTFREALARMARYTGIDLGRERKPSGLADVV